MENAVLVRRAWELIEPELAALHYEVVEIEYVRQGSSPVLRVFVDKEGGGISLDDCTRVSQVLGPVLDDSEFLASQYVLEVSSPGFDRPIRKPEHFRRYAGEKIRLHTHIPIEGRSRFKGVLAGVEGDLITMAVDGKEIAIHLENIKRAHLDR